MTATDTFSLAVGNHHDCSTARCPWCGAFIALDEHERVLDGPPADYCGHDTATMRFQP